ncbi:MAG: DUF4365 domain-containing protein [Chloroflexota bacterium]|nr:DUF4365 domain-containing protein [Chloroflexota bacterium]
MQDLQLAYVDAVVARAGYTCDHVKGSNDYGTDVMISDTMEESGTFSDTGPPVRCQLKASITYEVKSEYIACDMEVGAYNKLVNPRRGFIILIVFKLPKDEKEWLKVNDDCMSLKNCCYWDRIVDEKSENRSKKRIKIPRIQRFDPPAVAQILRLSREYYYVD